MRHFPWALIGAVGFALACFGLAVDYSVRHPEASVPAFLAYLTIGCMGLFSCLALASLHRRVTALERRLGASS
jgi:predicted membrane channel-forming protein YqfA (hemolysin III family)